MKYENKTVIVTGASKGIGRAILKKCADFGANVVAVYKTDDEAAESLKSEVKQNLLVIKADVSKEVDVKRIIRQTVKRFSAINVLVNNVGTNDPKPISDYKLSEWNAIVSSNLTSVFLCTKYAIPYLEESKGVIINISSRAGFSEIYLPNQIPYSVSKAAVTKFTIDAAKALADKNIRVNAVIPTVTRTQRLKIFTKEEIERLERESKLGSPEEVADLVMELIDDTSANGKILIDKRVKI
jgi:3-oxoacyl-[acyl-carrier protein] reductase